MSEVGCRVTELSRHVRVNVGAMHATRLLVLLAATALACEPFTDGDETIEVTLRLKLAQGYDVGPTPGKVFIYSDTMEVFRGHAFPENAEEVCVLATTPVTTCTISVPRWNKVSLVATEPDPSIVVSFAPRSDQDTVRDGRYVEFTGWTDCEERAERGLCVFVAQDDITIEGNFQLLQQVIIYQTGAARMHYRMYSAGPTLKVPAENYNILDYAGCHREFGVDPWSMFDQPCDSVRAVGDSPYHRF